MHTIGLIAEYNPFHNGHLYQINKIKELYKDSCIVLILSTSFTQRGNVSLLDKWTKTKTALHYGIDLVIELPFIFSTQSADIFAQGAIEILKNLKIDTLVFGSESNDIEKFKIIAKTQLNNTNYDKLVKKYLDKGINYPTSMNKALRELTNLEISTPNDLLALSYIKEIMKQNANIEPVSIKRTNDYHNKELNDTITSATSIREALKNNIEIKDYIPEFTHKYIPNMINQEEFFPYLKYKILSDNDLEKYLDVDEGLESRIKKSILESNNYEELINNIKTKRYTYNKINRMLVHILCNFTKQQKELNKHIKYIRVLGFSNIGKKHLNKIKKELTIPLLTKYNKLLDDEIRITCIYTSILDNKNQKELIQAEYKNHPIIRK